MAVRYTEKQKASPYIDQYKKERARIQSFISSAKRRGITFTKDILPPVPKEITEASVRRLQNITPEHGYYEHAEYMRVSLDTGAIIFKKGSQTALSRGVTEVSKRIETGERWVTAKKANEYGDFRKWLNDVEHTDYTEPEEPDYQFRPDLNDTKPEHIDTTPQDEIDETGDYWNEDSYYDNEPDYDEDYVDSDENEYEDTDEDDYDYDNEPYDDDEDDWGNTYDDEFTSDNTDRNTSYSERLDRVSEMIDGFIDYVGNNVSKRWADHVREAVDQAIAAFGNNSLAAKLLDNKSFWEDLASVVAEYYKANRKADPKPFVMERIMEELTGRTSTMEESINYDDEAYMDDSEFEF